MKYNNMSISELTDELEKAKNLVEELTKKISNAEFKFNYKSNNLFYVNCYQPGLAVEANTNTIQNEGGARKLGAIRLTSESALFSTKKRIESNILEAVGELLLGYHWEPNYENSDLKKFCIFYDNLNKKFYIESIHDEIIGAPVFSFTIASAIMDLLNNNQLKLIKKREVNL